MTILGIDPGLSGAIAYIDPENLTWWVPMPLAGGELDAPAIANLIGGLNPDVAVVERLQVMPKNGKSGNFTSGKNFGVLLGVLGALGVRTELVRPQDWKRKVLEGTAKDKAAAIAYCRRVFPDVELKRTERCTTFSDGAADALCLCEYGRRTYRNTA